MKELNQEQHIQLLQFMSLMLSCKSEEELQELKEQYYNIPRYKFLEKYISEKKENQTFSSYKTNLIYEMDKHQRDYKFVYGENFPIYRKESMYNNKSDYTVLNLLNEISECDNIEAYQKLLNEKNKFPKVKIETISSDFTGIYFSNGLPDNIIVNSPESNFDARKQLVESGYSPFTIPSVEDVKENGFEWLHEEISYFKETLNPNFIEMKKNEIIDNGIEQIQADYELSENAIENSYDAEQNSKPDYLDKNGNSHWFSDEKNEIDEGISDEELIQIYKQKYPDSSLNISEDTKKELENVFSKIDDYLDKGIVPEERRFTLPKTPSYLQKLGSDETVISLPVFVIKKAKETHGLSNEEIKNSLLRFYDPVVVFDTDKEKSENKQDSKLIITDEFAENKPIALAVNTNSQIQIQESGHRTFIEVQDIRSIHDRTLIAKNRTDLIKQWTENGLCRYVDDKKISDWSTVARVYFPIEALQSDKNNILIKSEIVNSQENPDKQELKGNEIMKNEMNQESELNIGENGNEILYDGLESETGRRRSIKAIDVWNEIYENIAENPEYEAIKFETLDYLYNKGTDDAAGYDNSFERNINRLEEISKSDKQLESILKKYKDCKIDFDDKALTVKIAGTRNNNFNKAKQDLLDFVENKKYLRESEINQKQGLSLFDKELYLFNNGQLDENHVFNLGKPGEILKNCGFPENDRIELVASRLKIKASQGNHPFEIMDILGLDKALQNPIAVFEYGEKEKAQNVIVNLEKDGKNFLVGVFFNQKKDGFEVSSIRGLFNRDNLDWMRWIQQGKMIYGDKERIQVLANQQRTNLADVNSKEARTLSDLYYLDSLDNILQNFAGVKNIYTRDFPRYTEQKEKFEIFKQFRSAYQETDSINIYDAVKDADEFYKAIKNNDKSIIEKFTNGIEKAELASVASLILENGGSHVQLKDINTQALNQNLHQNSESVKQELKGNKTMKNENSKSSEQENKLTKEQAAKAVSLVSKQGFSQNNQEEIAIMFNKLKAVNSIAEKNNEPIIALDFENPILISEAQIFAFDKNITEENKSKINELPYAVITVPDKDIEEGEEQTFHQEKYYLLDSLPNKNVILNQNQENKIDLSKVIVFDTETTGVKAGEDELLQISIIDGNGKELFNKYVKPEHKTSWEDAEKINGISPNSVKDCPSVKEYVSEIESILNNAELFMSYNGNFDVKFLEAAGIRVPNTPHLDIMKPAASITKFPARKNDNRAIDGYHYPRLVDVSEKIGFKYKAHDSLGDTTATLEVAKNLYGKNLEKLTPEIIQKYSPFIQKENSINFDENEKYLNEDNFEKYIHSEEFALKFGDWEKANRLEKLRNAEPIIKDGKITLDNSDITETVESLIYNEDRKGLQSLEKEIGKNILGAYVNQDTGLTINVSNRNVTEISNHHYLFKEHIQSLAYVPEIIDKAILIGEVENEDKQKHPNIEKYLYFGTGIKIDGVDYTCKSVIGIDKNNNCYYDQSLSTIEKGRLVDYIFRNEKVGNLSPLITQRETDLEGNNLTYVYYDKRLINICQVPQMPYLEMVNEKWQPKEESIQAVKEGKLFIEKIGQGYTMHDEKKTSNEQNDDYIHSEEFISKFGDWEKANRLEKLKQAETLVGNSKITVLGNDITDLVERLRTEYSVSNLKQLQNIAKDIGKEVISEYRKKQKLDEYSNPEFKNIDIGENYKLQWTGIKEIKGHNIFQKGHIEAIRAIPEIIEKGIYIGKEPNEDGRNPNLKEFYYFASGLKIDSDDYTVKSVFVKNDKGQIFYDQSLSSIEKGKFVDIIQEKNKPETVNLVNTKDSFELLENKSPSNYYDKRLINICQVPQMPYLEMVNGEWRPTQKAIKAVEDGKLFLEKNGQTYIMHDESFLEEKTVENEERESSKEEFDRLSNLLGNATDSEGQDFKAKFDAKNQDTKQIIATLFHETRAPEEAYALSPSYFDFESEEKDGDGYDMRWDLYENIATKILSDKTIISMEQVEILIEEESFRLEEKYNKEHNITQKQEYQKEEQYEQEWPGLATWKELADVVGKDIYVYKDDVLENNEGISERKWKTEALARILNDGILDLRGFDTESTSKINSLQYDNDFMKTIKGEVYKAINPEKWDVLTKVAEDTVDEYSPEIVGLTVDTLQIRYDEKLSEDHVYLESVEKGLVEIDKNMAERILDNNNPRLLEDGVKMAIVKASFEKDTPEWEKPERFIVTPHDSFLENYTDKELADYLTDNRINSTEPKISEKQAGIISYYLMRNEYALYTDKKGNLNCVDFSEDFNTENIDVMTNKDLLKFTMDLINKDIGFKDRAEDDLKEIQAVFNDYEQTQKILKTRSSQELYDSFIGKVEKTINDKIIDNDISAENSETESQNKSQNYENNNSYYSAPRPRNVQELHRFFINNPYIPGTPIPTIAMRNEHSGHFTLIEGYEFARFEDIGKPNLAFFEEDKKTGKLVRVKPDGQTVVLTKPGFREEIDEESGEKKLVPDENKRKFIKISRDLYEQAVKNSEIIAKRNPKTKEERVKMIDDYREAANLDEKDQRANTASNFWHNYQAGVMTLANNKQEAMSFAKRLVNEMIPSEKAKFARMVRKYEKLRGSDGKHLSYDQRIIDFYDNMGLKITSNSIWRDHINSKYNTLDAIKLNTEVFDKEGQLLDKTCCMKIGDTIKMSVTVDSVLSNKKTKLPTQEYRLVAHSKDNNSVALISADGKQKIIKNRDDFIKAVQKIEKKQLKKQQRQDRYESISM